MSASWVLCDVLTDSIGFHALRYSGPTRRDSTLGLPLNQSPTTTCTQRASWLSGKRCTVYGYARDDPWKVNIRRYGPSRDGLASASYSFGPLSVAFANRSSMRSTRYTNPRSTVSTGGLGRCGPARRKGSPCMRRAVVTHSTLPGGGGASGRG